MKYVRLETLLTSDLDYCFAGSVKDANACANMIRDGVRVDDAYPSDPFSVSVHLDPEFTGVKLPSMIGNTRKLVIISKEALALFEEHLDLGDHESFAFSLINHKGRVHSKDYLFLNPVGGRDIAHPSTDFLRFPSGGIYECKKWVLAAAKLDGLPDIVRAQELPTHYFVSERFVDLVAAHALTNFQFEPVAHA